MTRAHRIAFLSLLTLVLVGAASAPRAAQAEVSEMVLALAGPLAQQFGVPQGAVKGLLEGGLSLESVTQLLLVSQSSGSGLDSVTSLYRESNNDIASTAGKLDVDPAAYGQKRVTAAIDEAKLKVQTAASEEAAEGASNALDSALGNLKP